MTCSKCGAQNIAGAKFCDGCGAKLEAAPPPATASPAEPDKRFCISCGGALKPAARFCALCGTAQDPTAPGGSQPAPRPQAPAPQPVAPVYPAPAPQAPAAPAYQAPAYQAPVAPAYQAPAGSAPSHSSAPRTGGKGCRVGCVILLVLLAALVAGGYYIWNNIVLSSPAALTGAWEIKAGKSSLASEKFSFVPVEGGAKLVPDGAQAMPVDIILKPAGSHTFKARITNPADSTQWAEITVVLENINHMKINASMSDGTKDDSEATRVGTQTP